MAHFRPLHKIFILDALLQNLLDESNPRALGKAYFERLLETIQMKPLAPMSISLATDMEAPGFTGIQELTTSHTSFHYFWEPHAKGGNPNVHIDIYSCAPFSYEDVLRVAHGHFGLVDWAGTYIERAINPHERLTMQLRGKGDTVHERLVLTTGKEVPSRSPVRVPAMVRVR